MAKILPLELYDRTLQFWVTFASLFLGELSYRALHVPRSVHPKETHSTYTFDACSITAKSMEMFMHDGKLRSIYAASSCVPKISSPASKMVTTSGQYSWNALMIAEVFHRKIPESQKNSPVSRNTFASSRFGFSVNVFTFSIPGSHSAPILI